jgi:Flp pilus assembly protein TadD
VALAPDSASAANTLGTLLQGVGDTRSARQWFERAFILDPHASYALVNICYSAVMLGQRDALDRCRRAVALAPASTVARNNLALAYAARGDFASARDEFQHARNSVAEYNLGIAYLATRNYHQALTAFHAALNLDPTSTAAAQRAQQARASALAEDDARNHE